MITNEEHSRGAEKAWQGGSKRGRRKRRHMGVSPSPGMITTIWLMTTAEELRKNVGVEWPELDE